MKGVLQSLRSAMDQSMVRADEAENLIQVIYGRFEDEYKFADLNKPQVFSLEDYQIELERIFEEGEEFRQSTYTTLMEQSTAVHRLYSTVIAEARDLFAKAHQNTNEWGSNALTPLAHRIKDRKLMIDNRLGVLRKVTGSNETLEAEIAELEKRLVMLNKKLYEIQEILQIVTAAVPSA